VHNALVHEQAREREVAEVRRRHLLLKPVLRQRERRRHHRRVENQCVQALVLGAEGRRRLLDGLLAA
jgi:hypothetical protein